ncbi:uncharacterized protein LOC123550941 isoform X2 [Mercenaria mercenaria]|uniref:uncharacterized protein LOC123550941 isoform X2 n=1 Tax=Mercenaria mercenaria TaxID=6596 RepID=UPI00234E9AD0|nr:uncharacterized protein LOC123550941 isoform X2 [Mercenaria mercenaria]
MVSICEMSFKVMMLLTVIFNLSEAEPEICFKRTQTCKGPSYILRCKDGVIQQISFKYVVENTHSVRCCNLQSDYDADFQECQKDISRRCTVPSKSMGYPDDSDREDTEEECDYERYFKTATGIEYKCTKDVKALPPSCNSDTTEDGGGTTEDGGGTTEDGGGTTEDIGETSMVIVPIIAVLAALIIAAVVLAVVLYLRRSRKKRNGTKALKVKESSKGKDNAGTEDEYNTIPADYEEIPQNSYQALESKKTDTEHAYSNKSRDDSVRYSTIVLNEDTETNMNAYGYDKTNLKISYEANELKDQESLHSYGHFSDTSDDYNKIRTNLNRHNVDKEYAHFESEQSSDYSHLHDKNKDLQHMPSNNYNHLQTKFNPTRPIKRADSYEQPVLKDRKDVRLSEPKAKTGEYETSVKDVEPSETKVDFSRDGKMQRKDSYEEPVLICTSASNDILKNEPKVNLITRDDYEAPVSLKDASVDNSNVSTNGTMKRKDSYEIPVLKNTDVSKDYQ